MPTAAVIAATATAAAATTTTNDDDDNDDDNWDDNIKFWVWALLPTKSEGLDHQVNLILKFFKNLVWTCECVMVV